MTIGRSGLHPAAEQRGSGTARFYGARFGLCGCSRSDTLFILSFSSEGSDSFASVGIPPSEIARSRHSRQLGAIATAAMAASASAAATLARPAFASPGCCVGIARWFFVAWAGNF